jgi:hypothetical protein
MTKLETVGAGVVLAVAGGALGLLLEWLGVTHFLKPQGIYHPFQVPGDPPVMVGDGSLHVDSKKGWVKDDDNDSTIVVKTAGNSGSFYTDANCSFSKPDGTKVTASAFLWTDDDQLVDISPKDISAWKVTVTDGHTTITISAPSNVLQLYTDLGGFDKTKHGTRQHDSLGEITAVTVVGSASPDFTWKPSKPYHPHYSLGFCYK